MHAMTDKTAASPSIPDPAPRPGVVSPAAGISRGGTPSTKASLEVFIQECLKLDYVSTSCKDDIQTGNHYQSVQLGASRTAGFRSDRTQFLDRIDFVGKKVLDLGSNLGELSRDVRARGADIVDGFEYDSFFIQVAQLLNAYHSSTRVSFYHRDITDEESYRKERYDVVMAFSVWTYVQSRLDSLSNISDVLVVETHNLNGNLQRDYVDSLRQFFPSHAILGESDWGRQQESGGGRSVFVCAKDDDILRLALRAP